MPQLLKKSLSHVAIVAIIAAPTTVAVVSLPTEAVAQKGGNGNGNGNGRNRDREDRQQNGRSNNGRHAQNDSGEAAHPGRGAIARELKGLNAAHASPTALANASPNSMPGKLYTYQQAVLAERDYEAQLAETESTLNTLTELTEEQFLELNPDLNYAETLAAYTSRLTALQDAAAGADSNTTDALAALNGGTELSDAAMQELARMLGL